MHRGIGAILASMPGEADAVAGLSASEATVIAALVAAAVAIISGLVAAIVQIRIHRSKGPFEQEAALAATLREAITAFATEVARASHSMCWLTWAATQGRGGLPLERVERFNLEMHEILPRIAGQLTSIAALDPNSFEHLEPVAERIFEADARVGEAGEELRHDAKKGTALLGELHGEISAMEREVRREVAGIARGRIPELFRELARNR